MTTRISMHDIKAIKEENGKVAKEQRIILGKSIKSLDRIIASGDKGTREYWTAVARREMEQKELRRINRVFCGM